MSECVFLGEGVNMGRLAVFLGWIFRMGRPSGPTHKPDAPYFC